MITVPWGCTIERYYCCHCLISTAKCSCTRSSYAQSIFLYLSMTSAEAYEQEVVARIELAETNGQAPWAEFNRQNLETRIRPALAMLREGQTYAKGSKYDREYTPEEWEQRQARRQQEGHA